MDRLTTGPALTWITDIILVYPMLRGWGRK